MSVGGAKGDVGATSAPAALERLGAHRSEHRLLNVQCGRSHHLASVYRTDAGPVYRSLSGPHAHGSLDFVDTPHRGGRRHEYVVLLDPATSDTAATTSDELPAWCDCGPVMLSRAELLEHLRAGRHTVHIS